jgi:tripartite-type tricarboxylate transporter receptor subunit TctC
VLQSLVDPELRERFRAQDIVIAPATSVEARARIESDLQLWAKVVKAAGMQVD